MTRLPGPCTQIRLLPSGVEIFSSSAVTLFPTVIEDGETERQIADSVDPDDVKVDRISLAYVGRNGQEALHLLVSALRSGIGLYESSRLDAHADPLDEWAAGGLRGACLVDCAIDSVRRRNASLGVPLCQDGHSIPAICAHAPQECTRLRPPAAEARLATIPIGRRPCWRLHRGRRGDLGPQGRARTSAMRRERRSRRLWLLRARWWPSARRTRRTRRRRRSGGADPRGALSSAAHQAISS